MNSVVLLAKQAVPGIMVLLNISMGLLTNLPYAAQVNYNLLAVNFFMAFTGIYQLSRKINAGSPETDIPATQAAQTTAVSGAGPQVPLDMPNQK